MNGTEIMNECQKQTDCEHCPSMVKSACKKWKEELLKIEPAELMKLVDAKEF